MDPERNINISITSGTIFKTVLIVLTVLLLFAIKDIVLVVLTSIVVASAIEPLILWFKKYKIKRLPGVIITYLSLALFFSGIIYFFIPPLVADTSNFLGAVPKYLDSISLWNPLNEDLAAQKDVAASLSKGLAEGQEVVGQITSNKFSLQDFVDNLSKAFSNISQGAFQTISAVFGGILSFILIVVLSFYLAVQENGIGNFLKVILPGKYEEYAVGLWKRAEHKIGYWIQGQMLLALLVGVLVYLSLVVLGIKNALVLAVIAATFEIIPLFGPILSSIPAIAIAFADAGMSHALIVAGVYVIIHQFENHLFYPLVVKKIIGVPPIIVIIALVVGAKLAGFLGLILSVPIAATLMELFNDLEKKKLKSS